MHWRFAVNNETNTTPQLNDLPPKQEDVGSKQESISEDDNLNFEQCSEVQHEDLKSAQQEQLPEEEKLDETFQSLEAHFDGVKHEFVSSLKNNIPRSQTSDVPTPKSKEKEIDDANKAAKAIIKSYEKSENNRLGQQKPILLGVTGALAVQLLFFNILMFIIVIKSFQNFQAESFSLLLEFLKYYIGAVVLELIGLMAVIIKSAFSQNPSQAIKKLIERGDATTK